MELPAQRVGVCVAGALCGAAFATLILPAGFAPEPVIIGFRILSAALGTSLGLAVTPSVPARSLPSSSKLIDTSVLIDGRIAAVAKAGFLAGPVIVPEFVLRELQGIADSADMAKRNRGRRGLDTVEALEQSQGLQVEISYQDFPALAEVDLKLIELAKLRGCSLVTNDFNLNKLAHVQGIAVLNVNDLAAALRPVVLPGEMMRILIAKEGKEAGQGVGYLDDGTIVVVDNGRRFISRTVDVTVTSVIQTSAGKMIFAKA